MAESVDPVALLDQFVVAAAWCDPSGLIAATNEAFSVFAPDSVGQQVDIAGARGVVLRDGAPPLSFGVVPMAGGGWLIFPNLADASGALPAVAGAVARRLGRVESALEENARIGLISNPTDAVRASLREVLVTAEEVRVLRRQVAALGASPSLSNEPISLLTLVKESASAVRPRRILVEAPDQDFAIEGDRARLFPLLVALFEELSVDAQPLRVTLRGGDQVRLRIESALVPAQDTFAVAEARRLLSLVKGRLFATPGEELILEIPAYVRGTGAGGGLGTVLVVDDDESSLAMMGAVLRRAGFRILSAEDGVEASAILRERLSEIRAIVADAVLPGRSGVELAAEARRASPHLPVLLVSGHSSDLLGAEGLVGVPILSKPFAGRTLADRVKSLVDD